MLLISDLDGTLLDGEKKIPPKAVTAIQRFVDNGNRFTIATGRTEDTCKIATEFLPVNAPVILYNGACIMELETKKVLFQRTISAKAFRPLINEVMEKFPDVCIEIFAYGPLILVNPEAIMDPYIIRENQPYLYMTLDETPEKWLKIMFSASHDRLVEMEKILDKWWPVLPDSRGFYSAEYYYEIVNDKCSKGECASFLSKHLNIPQNEIAAIGDHLNDVEVIKWVGHGYAPRNARREVKKYAKVLEHTNDQEAICDMIEELLR